MRENKRFAATSSLALAGLVLVPAAGAYVDAFHSPARAIYCEADRTATTVVLACSVEGQGVKQWYMRPSGHARVHRMYSNIATETRVLRYGRTWKKVGFTCTSRRIGLTCRNRSGHGWFLSRQRQRIV